MNLYNNKLYLDDIHLISESFLPWHILKNKSIMLSGATGLIGSFLIDVIMEKNADYDLNCTIYALGRNITKANKRFFIYDKDPHFIFIPYDVRSPLKIDELINIDYIIHLASNTNPVLYSTDPIGTIMTNIIGLQNLLNFAVEHHTERFVFASSNEIYGENLGDVEIFNEDYCGYINCNTLRAGYPESKRCGEALCQAYIKQKNMDVVISRFTRTYGPTMLMNDTKAVNQFIKNALANEDIVLKSAGLQYYSFTYVSDAVSGLLTAILKGKKGEAYNISFNKGDIRLKDLAEIIAQISGRKVVYENPDNIEAEGYSKVTKARLDSQKLQALGWKPQYAIKPGLERTIKILKNI